MITKFKNYNIVYAASDFIKKQIKGTEWENKIYIAGGAVRDELLGVVPKDLDLLVDEIDGGIRFADWLTKILGIYRDGANPVVYPRFGTAKFNLRGIKFMGYDLSNLDIESVMPRSEKYEEGSRKPDIEFSSLKMDSERRDLTINSMFKNISTGEILDITGKGMIDLEKKIIKAPLNPDIIFTEDPLRMMRAISASCKLEFDLPMSMIRSMNKNSKKLMYISNERISDELSKMLLTKSPDKAIRILQMTRLSKYIFPELDNLIGLKQNKHHDLDAMGHTLKVLRNTPPDLITRLAALFHDIGKYKTMTNDEGNVHFYDHEELGAHIARDILNRLKFPKVIREPVFNLIINHMRTKQVGNKGIMSNRALRKLRNEVGDDLDRLLDLIHADNISHAPDSCMPDQIPTIRKKLEELIIKDDYAPINPPINGNDIQRVLRIEKGPIVGEILNKIKDMYLDNPHMTKEEAEEIVKKLYKK